MRAKDELDNDTFWLLQAAANGALEIMEETKVLG